MLGCTRVDGWVGGWAERVGGRCWALQCLAFFPVATTVVVGSSCGQSMYLLLYSIPVVSSFVLLPRNIVRAFPSNAFSRRSFITRSSAKTARNTMMFSVDEDAGYRIERAGGDWDDFSEQMHDTMDKCLARVQKFRR